MNTLYMKIHSYDDASTSLIVSFASDKTKSQDPNMYPQFAFQPVTMWPDVTDITELKKRIAVAGMYHAQQQANEEAFIEDPARINALKAIVGELDTYSVNALISNSDDVRDI